MHSDQPRSTKRFYEFTSLSCHAFGFSSKISESIPLFGTSNIPGTKMCWISKHVKIVFINFHNFGDHERIRIVRLPRHMFARVDSRQDIDATK